MSTFFPYDAVTRPVQAAINKYHAQQIEPQSINRFLMDMFFSADGPIGELIAPFVNQSIALETITEVLSNKKKEGGQIYSELDGFPEIFNKSLAHIFRSAEPGAVTTGRQLYYGFQETLTPTGGTYDIGDVLILSLIHI